MITYDEPTEKEYKYLSICYFSANQLSTCAKRKYYSKVFSPDGWEVGSGYNGSPPGYPHCVDGACPRQQAGSAPGSSYSNCVANHAEINALMHSTPDRRGGKLIVNGQPCWDCARAITGSGVKRVVGIQDFSYADAERTNQFLLDNGIEVVLGSALQVRAWTQYGVK